MTIELNLSCPNVDEAPESAAEIVAACRAATSLPLYAKLSPAAWDIAEVARAVEAAGADGLSLVNTIRGLALDERLRPRLARGAGGYSGPALKPIALAAVYACRRVTQLPIVGMGGVRTGRDALELIACGATHVALGTVLFADPEAPARVRPRACQLSAQMPDLTTPRMPFPPLRKLFSLRATRPFDGGLHEAARVLVCPPHGAARLAGSSSGQVARPANGGSQEGQRHPGQAGAAEEGSQVRRRLDRADPARAARSSSRRRRCSTC